MWLKVLFLIFPLILRDLRVTTLLRIFEPTVRRAHTYAYPHAYLYKCNPFRLFEYRAEIRYNYLNARRDLFAWNLQGIIFLLNRQNVRINMTHRNHSSLDIVIPHVRMIVFART